MNADSRVTEAEVIDFLRQYEDASGTRSFANVIGMIHPNALFRFNDGDYRGPEAVQGAFERTWAYDVKDDKYQLADVDVIHTDANSATVTFAFRWSGVALDGPFDIIGRGTMVLVRHDGKLKILVEHLSR